MPRMVQIRDIDDDVHQELGIRAAEVGMSVPDLLRREAVRLAGRPSVARSRSSATQWPERTRGRGWKSRIARSEVLEALDEVRGEWPDGVR